MNTNKASSPTQQAAVETFLQNYSTVSMDLLFLTYFTIDISIRNYVDQIPLFLSQSCNFV